MTASPWPALPRLRPARRGPAPAPAPPAACRPSAEAALVVARIGATIDELARDRDRLLATLRAARARPPPSGPRPRRAAAAAGPGAAPPPPPATRLRPRPPPPAGRPPLGRTRRRPGRLSPAGAPRPRGPARWSPGRSRSWPWPGLGWASRPVRRDAGRPRGWAGLGVDGPARPPGDRGDAGRGGGRPPGRRPGRRPRPGAVGGGGRPPPDCGPPCPAPSSRRWRWPLGRPTRSTVDVAPGRPARCQPVPRLLWPGERVAGPAGVAVAGSAAADVLAARCSARPALRAGRAGPRRARGPGAARRASPWRGSGAPRPRGPPPPLLAAGGRRGAGGTRPRLAGASRGPPLAGGARRRWPAHATGSLDSRGPPGAWSRRARPALLTPRPPSVRLRCADRARGGDRVLARAGGALPLADQRLARSPRRPRRRRAGRAGRPPAARASGGRARRWRPRPRRCSPAPRGPRGPVAAGLLLRCAGARVRAGRRRARAPPRNGGRGGPRPDRSWPRSRRHRPGPGGRSRPADVAGAAAGRLRLASVRPPVVALAVDDLAGRGVDRDGRRRASRRPRRTPSPRQLGLLLVALPALRTGAPSWAAKAPAVSVPSSRRRSPWSPNRPVAVRPRCRRGGVADLPSGRSPTGRRRSCSAPGPGSPGLGRLSPTPRRSPAA